MNSGGTQSAFAQSAKTLSEHWIGSRKKVSLWLDLKVTRELEALEIIQRMKSKREFRKSVMIGVKIIFELRQGKVDTLLAEFPNIRELLGVRVGDDDRLKGDIDEIKRLLRERQITQHIDAPPADYPVMKPVDGGIKQIGGFKPLAAPTFDDFDDDLPEVAVKGSDINAAENLVRAMTGLQRTH